jgi:excisionase family DNA binding protein
MEAPNATPDERLSYSIETLARVTDVSRATIRRAISRGDLPVARVNRRVLILKSDALAWLGGTREAS